MLTLSYAQGENEYDSAPKADDIEPDMLKGAIFVIATQLGVHEKSVPYLLEYGWRQTLQDSFAGPRAKAVNDGESDETVANVVHGAINKRLDALKAGTMVLGATGGRDPLRSVAQSMIENAVRAAGQTPPSKTTKDGKAEWKVLVDQMLQTRLELVKAEVQKRRTSKSEKVEIKLDALQF